MIPIAGSACTYAYATLGELLAWMIGWDLAGLGVTLPTALSTAPPVGVSNILAW